MTRLPCNQLGEQGKRLLVGDAITVNTRKAAIVA